MATKAIWIDWRHPKYKKEETCYGLSTFDNPSTAHVFINTKKCNTGREQTKTFWHEMVHVFLRFHSGKRLSVEQEELLCVKIENILWEVLR